MYSERQSDAQRRCFWWQGTYLKDRVVEREGATENMSSWMGYALTTELDALCFSPLTEISSRLHAGASNPNLLLRTMQAKGYAHRALSSIRDAAAAFSQLITAGGTYTFTRTVENKHESRHSDSCETFMYSQTLTYSQLENKANFQVLRRTQQGFSSNFIRSLIRGLATNKEHK